MTPPRQASRLVQWCLRALVPKDEAEAVFGDLNEDVDAGTAPSAAQIEWRAWRYAFALAPEALRRGGRSFRHVMRDAARSLRSAPAATAGTVLILTLGISAATVTFSVVDTVVFRPLPFSEDQDLATVDLRDTRNPQSAGGALGPFQYLTLREHLRSFASLAAVARTSSLALSAGGGQVPLETVQVTASLFETLRARPFIGQLFTADHEFDGNRVALISHDLWQRQFGSDPGIVGRTIAVTRRMAAGGVTGRESLVVLGVMPRGFAYPISMVPSPDVWTPYVMAPEERTGAQRDRYLHVVGRLRSGGSLGRSQSEARAAAAALSEAEPDFYRTRNFGVVSLKDTLVGNVRGWMLLVLGAVAVVMLIACVNVANLQLVRSARRTRELSIRASLGATHRQLIASLLVESLLLSLMSAALAIVLAIWGIQVAKAALPADLVRAAEIGLNLRVLGATISSAVVTGLLFGAVPAWQASREDLVSLLKQGTMTLGVSRRRWRSAFVVAEVAFVSMLLVGATLVISSFVRVTTADLGFDRSNLLFVSGDNGVDAADTGATIDRLRSLPGVAGVGAVALGSPPLAAAGFRHGGASATSVNPLGHPSSGPPAAVAEIRSVSSGYFGAAGIPVIAGRSFDDVAAVRDTAIVIDERVAAQLFAKGAAVGAEVIVFGRERRTVVAVVRHVQQGGPERAASPQVYVPAGIDKGGFNFLVRTSASPEAVIPSIRAVFPAAVTSGTAALQIRPLEDAFRNITADRRFNAGLMSIFGALAMVIGAAGIYGVLASVVAQQLPELALRVALGATTSRITAGLIVQAGRYLVAGLALGLSVAWWASRTIASILYDVRPTDVGVYAVVAGVVTVVGLAAAWIPARRASRVDPLLALRSD